VFRGLSPATHPFAACLRLRRPLARFRHKDVRGGMAASFGALAPAQERLAAVGKTLESCPAICRANAAGCDEHAAYCVAGLSASCQCGLTKPDSQGRCFVENDISFSVLSDLTDQNLKEIGVSFGHRLQLL
jgi:hypothetical protein